MFQGCTDLSGKSIYFTHLSSSMRSLGLSPRKEDWEAVEKTYSSNTGPILMFTEPRQLASCKQGRNNTARVVEYSRDHFRWLPFRFSFCSRLVDPVAD